MSSQRHGKQFEDILKALLYSGAADRERSPVKPGVDIEADFDRKLGLPTSVKASKSCLSIGLADARTWWKMQGPMRMMVACWHQVSAETKEFHEIHEFILHGSMLHDMRVGVSYEQVAHLHDGLKNFPVGQHVPARKWTQAEKSKLPKCLIILNPKIDSKSQRRLQCSVRMSDLIEFVGQYGPLQDGQPNHTVYRDFIGDLILPQRIRSKPRDKG